MFHQLKNPLSICAEMGKKYLSSEIDGRGID